VESEIKKSNYKDALEPVELPFVFKILVGQRWPWVFKVFRWVLFIILYPFKRIIKQMPGANVGHLSKLYDDKKYEEGYRYGLEQLSSWSRRQKSNVFLLVHDFMWWQIFDQTCYCAEELNRADTLVLLTELISKAPETNIIHLKATGLCHLSHVAWKLNQSQTAFEWVEKAIKVDDTHAWALYLRGWYGVVLEQGQPLQDFASAIQIDPSFKERVFTDEFLISKSPLLMNLEAELAKG